MSSPQLVFNSDYALIQYYPEAKIVHHILLKPIAGETFRNVLQAGLDTMQQYSADKWLSDDRVNAGISAEDEAWSTTVWRPQAVAAGWKFWALVVPDTLEARADMTYIVTHMPQWGVRVMLFTKTEDALEWLAQRP